MSTKDKQNKPILGYWNIRGVTHPIRFLLAYLNVDYEEQLYPVFPPFEGRQWMNEKYTLGLDFPNIPYWIDENVKLTESKVILRYLAEKYDPTKSLIPQNEKDLLSAQMVENIANEVTRDLCFTCWKDPDEIRDYNVERYQNKIRDLSKFLGEKTWILGDKICYADFFLYEAIHINGQYEPKLLIDHPNLQKYKEKFESLPQIKAYMNSEGFIKGPCNSKLAKRVIN